MRYEISNAKGKMRYEKIRAFLHGTGVNVRPVMMNKTGKVRLHDVEIGHIQFKTLEDNKNH
jgi:hypothetical protein